MSADVRLSQSVFISVHQWLNGLEQNRRPPSGRSHSQSRGSSAFLIQRRLAQISGQLFCGLSRGFTG
jgi:hypothetical protein